MLLFWASQKSPQVRSVKEKFKSYVDPRSLTPGASLYIINYYNRCVLEHHASIKKKKVIEEVNI